LELRFARFMGFLGLIVGAGFMSIGCAGATDDLPRLAVSGTVTLGGEPLTQGRIQFEPASAEAKIPAGGEITDGRFAIPRDQGPTPGDYRIMITSSVAKKLEGDNSPGAEPAKGAVKKKAPAIELIPKEYNSQTTLKEKVEAGKTTFEFTLKNSDTRERHHD
jgi:hypothetical protein